jgi:hypothetical protein
VFKNRVLRRIFGTKREEVAGDWRRLQNEELHNLYSPPNIRAMKLGMRWAEHVARTGEMRNAYNNLVGKPKGKRPLEGPVAGPCEHDNEPSGSIKGVEFLE